MKLNRLAQYALPLITALAAGGANADKVRVAVIDPSSGPFAAVAANWYKSMLMQVDAVNAQKLAGENTIELVAFDNKGSAQESQILLRTVIDQGFRYVIQGGSSAIGAVLMDAVNKHNERNQGKEILLLNHSNADPVAMWWA